MKFHVGDRIRMVIDPDDTGEVTSIYGEYVTVRMDLAIVVNPPIYELSTGEIELIDD